jgi:hypothetical protein
MDFNKNGDLKFVYAYLKILKNGDIIYPKESEFVDALIRLHKKGVKSIIFEGQKCAIFPYILQQYTFQYDIDNFESFYSIWDKQLKGLSRTDWAILRVQKILKEKKFNHVTKTHLFMVSSNPQVYYFSKNEFISYWQSVKYLPRGNWVRDNYNDCIATLDKIDKKENLLKVGTFFEHFITNQKLSDWGLIKGFDYLTKEQLLKQRNFIKSWYQNCSELERAKSINHLK